MASITGTSGNDKLAGTADNDQIAGADGDDTIYGGDGDDSLFGGFGNDTLYGDGGDDLFQGQQGDDELHGDAGQDRFQFAGGSGEDLIYGGETGDDFDSLEFFSSQDMRVVFTGDEAGRYVEAVVGSNGQFAGIESISTSSGDDELDASASGKSQTLSSGAGNDTVKGGSGADTIYGGSGDDHLSGGDGADDVSGGSGNDKLSGEDGDDTLSGGAGNDTLSGGAGNDTFVLADSEGDDVITDFDTADTDADGRFNDQIDVSDLQNADGSPVTGFDVVVTDDGQGNAVLTFPQGETLVLQGVSPAQMDSAGELYRAGIPCFEQNAPILTPHGYMAAGDLRVGDMVETYDAGPQPILWAGKSCMDLAVPDRSPHLRPVRVRAKHEGQDVVVSPQHGVLVCLAGDDTEVLVRARHLARLNGDLAQIIDDMTRLVYVHLLLPQHHLLMSPGLVTESFYPGPWGLRSLSGADQLRLCAIVPGLASQPVAQAYGATARRFARFAELPCDDCALRFVTGHDATETILV